MIKRRKTFLLLLAVISFFGCHKDDEIGQKQPKITNEEVATTSNSATISWMVDFPGEIHTGIEISLSEDLSDARSIEATKNQVNQHTVYSVSIDSLMPMTQYYYRQVVWNSYKRFEFEPKNFTTKAGLPVVQTLEVNDITRTSVVACGIVLEDGGAEVIERGVCWSTESAPLISDNNTSAGYGIGEFSVEVSGLFGGTTYHIRSYAKNREGVSYGNELLFTTDEAILPDVITSEVIEIAWKTAVGGGEVLDDGGASVTERGVCWGTSHNPTTNGNHAQNGTGNGAFSTNISGLRAETTYYVRAYAKNSIGTAYGNELAFTTLSGAPTGAINGLFSVGSSRKVYFSHGNLQYQASSGTWRFAPNQYSYIGSSNNNASQTYNGWIDLFGWGTSGWNSGCTCYHPWDNANTDGSLYGPGQNDLTGSGVNADWGMYNPISNGGNQIGIWRTLTKSEWKYVLETRHTVSGIRYAKAKVNNVNGVVLLPDNWSTGIYDLVNTNTSNADFSGNIISISTWLNTFETNGAVFLPAAGYRNGWVALTGFYGGYWSSSHVSWDNASEMCFDSDVMYPQQDSYRYYGESVRLVQDY